MNAKSILSISVVGLLVGQTFATWCDPDPAPTCTVTQARNTDWACGTVPTQTGCCSKKKWEYTCQGDASEYSRSRWDRNLLTPGALCNDWHVTTDGYGNVIFRDYQCVPPQGTGGGS